MKKLFSPVWWHSHHARALSPAASSDLDLRQLVRVIEQVSMGFNWNKSAAMALLDLAKAFDTVWIDGYPYKQIIIGVPRIINSYLTGRTFTVSVRE